MINHWHVQRAKRSIASGGIIAYPTESVWGLGCDPWNKHATERLLDLKKRSRYRGLILVASCWNQFQPLIDRLSPQQLNKLKAVWPGPTTWLLPDPDNWIPVWIKGKYPTVALRLSSNQTIINLCSEHRGLLISTSANISGKNPALSILQVRKSFGQSLDYIIPGKLGSQKQVSQICDLTNNTIIRRAQD